ncbi:MAG: NAD-dependent epimerase/dehydratase family protein [Planctomycetota bacterium]|nr:NAD-dependent epimerase/dehydratase family protein [Planctomycetota bacterium]
MKILVVGGTGHIGSFLIPRLIAAGHEVSVAARNPRPRYGDGQLGGWNAVRWIIADRGAEEKSGEWIRRMKGIDADVVVDLICYRPEQNEMMVEAFAGRVGHFIHCGTLWVYGNARRRPADESHPRNPIGQYGRDKAAIEARLMSMWREEGFPATVIHPGHISAKYWLPIDPQGTVNGLDIYRRLARGEKVRLPAEKSASLQHVHADDVAQIFELAIVNRETAKGRSFNAAAPYALTLTGCCEAVAAMFGARPDIEYVPVEELKGEMGETAWKAAADHVAHSPCCSIELACRLLGYSPRYTIERIYAECIERWLERSELKLN